ncbi:TIR domain-containing protein [Bacillus massilinigeriensis]|uniref:TIR domain-containing protein n=1 Tax=Bacillus massilionigeriensis TaxID=1805475 RepID=UPI00096AF79E|nr:toll/interleukin-1 receptor domain-containing protein [Bacillus massilionigeriensis]
MPSISLLESKIKRLHTDISRLEGKRAGAVKEESNSIKKINSANSALQRTKNSSTISSKLKEIERENIKIQKAKEEQAKLMSEIAKKNTELNKTLTELSKTQQKEAGKIYAQQEKMVKELHAQQKSDLKIITSLQNNELEETKEYDVFISHSANDKDNYVSELAEELKASGVTIWYDTDNIGWGQSIRKEIDKGLANSKYGIVVISPSFIEKYWTNYELDGILNKESSTGNQMILPIWHNVTADQVKKYSYSLAGKLALNSAINTIDDIVENVKKLIK